MLRFATICPAWNLASAAKNRGTHVRILLSNLKRPYASSSSSGSGKRPAAAVPLDRVRNIGVVAHVDAGKTTTCERMLFHAGEISAMGDVDRGDTTMDFLRLERERGITIKAAGHTLHWAGHCVNVIDTPGHVDFTIEVERAVRVLDGAVLVLDAVQGVQAQSETVWRQVTRYGVPRVCFVNKLDREGASLARAVADLRQRLHTQPLPLVLPRWHGRDLRQLIDLVNLRVHTFADATAANGTAAVSHSVQAVDVAADEEVRLAREQLVEQTAALDERLLDAALVAPQPAALPADQLAAAVARAVSSCRATAVLAGSSLKDRGVQLLLDAVVAYLPSPLQRPPLLARTADGREEAVKADASGPLVALAFKVVHDHQRGLITYVRVYRGTLRANTPLLNANTGAREKPVRLLAIRADELRDVSEVPAGHIGAVLGLKGTVTGHTLLDGRTQASAVVRLPSVVIPPPVFVCAVEPQTQADNEPLEAALAALQREDPSLQVALDPDTGQTLLRGMGELHLEIVADRLLNHYRAKARLGRMRIAYRSTVPAPSSHQFEYDGVLAGRKARASVAVEVRPRARGQGFAFSLAASEQDSGPALTPAARSALEAACQAACDRGVLYGLPLVDVEVVVQSARLEPADAHAALALAASRAVSEAARASGPVVLEPLMRLEVECAEDDVGPVLSDLTAARRASIRDVRANGTLRTVEAEAPLRELHGYASALRSMTAGRASAALEFLRYGDVAASAQQALIKDIRGF